MLIEIIEIEKADYDELSSMFSVLRKAAAADKAKAEIIGKKPLSTVTDQESQIYNRYRIIRKFQLKVVARLNAMADQVDLKEVLQ